MEQKVNEFAVAFDNLANCLGTIACGCQMNDEEEVDALILWSACRRYVQNFEKRTMSRNTWKPSEEQIYWLETVIDIMPDTDRANEAVATLKELLEDLKRLC